MRIVYRHLTFRRLVTAVLMLGITLDATANPTGMTVHGGSATATSSGSQLTVTTTSQNTLLNWQSFNIAAGETTIFQEPSTTSIVWNQINNANPSQIYGSLQANGIVVLLNSSGFYFGPNSFVSAAGLVVSTANYIPPQNSGGGWEFNGPPPLASIVNYGQINIGQGGSAFLIADHVENHGTISAPGGTVGLAAGQTVLLSDRPDGRGMSMQVTLPSGSVDNEGRLIADGGTIAMNAKVVNQNGFIQANSVQDVNGVIELVASDQLTLGANSQIIASGDNSPAGSAGGNVTLQSGNNFSDSVGSQIITTGGAQGGNGGNVEISAPNVRSLNSSINAQAQAGWTAGKLLLDPDYIILDTSGSGSAGSGTVFAGSNPGSTLDLNVNSAFANLAVSQIILQAAYDITLASGTTWNLSQTIGANYGGVTSGQLTLEAGRNIIFGDGSSISDANNWSVTLMAGVNNFNTGTIQPGTGNIYLNGGNGQTGSGSIQTASGSINLEAGNGIQIGSGIVSSSAGNITWQAGGDIQFGDGSQITDGNNGLVTLEAGYNFANNTVQSGVGNIYLNGGSGSIQLSQASINLTAGNSIVVGSGCQLIDNGGTIGLYAQTVNQNGLIQANSVGNQYGIIELVASDLLALGANSQITANGDNSSSGSAGGQIMLQTAQNFSDVSGSQIEARGGANGGDGGRILIYAASANSQLDVSAQAGSTSGSIFYYPQTVGDLTLTADSLAPFSGFSHILFQASGDITIAAGETLNLNAGTGSQTSGLLTLEAGGNILFGYDSSGTLLSAQIADAKNWSVTLQAGYNFANNSINYGTGSIYLGGFDGTSPQDFGGSIQTASGSINLMAGLDILVGSGYVITTGAGSISAHALAGNIDTGSDAQGYHFVSSGASSPSQAYNLSDGLGGISTEAGGDVTLIAGGNVTSVLPGSGGNYYYDGNKAAAGNGNDYLTAGAGAYGSQPGNVTIVAGGNVTGHYLVANGTGSIFAGVQMDANGNPETDSSGNYLPGTSGSAGTDLSYNGLALSLISGGWNVTAAQDILLQEVNNPNGDFNGGSSYNHYFNYASGDYVNLSAGDLVQLGASIPLPRLSGANNNLPIIYPSILNITAGDGGVILGAPGSTTSLTLFPSAQGSLTIDTTGSLVSDLNPVQGAPQLFNLIVSDAGHNQYTTTGNFGISDQATTPIHLNNPTPIALDIAGDMDLVNLVVPEAAQINVVGNMNNCGFQGMNLAANDVTSINVGGDIINRSSFTSVDLSQVSGEVAPLLSYLSQAEPLTIGSTSISATTLATSFYYNSTTSELTYENIPGVSLAKLLQQLQSLTVQVYQNGVPQFDSNGNPVTTTVSVLNGADAGALLAQYNTLGPLPYNALSYGYFIGGGGQFNITARTIDLGTSAGIQSEGVGGPYTVHGSYPLAQLFGTGGVFDHGADITITTTGNHSEGETAGDLVGDLDMYSSSIASLQGGNITIYAGGDVNAGSADFSVNTSSARGIYSTDQGNVFVYADGDINVNGSRIAVYDTRPDNSSGTPGGSVTVVSRNGNINAGSGGSGFVGVSSYLVNPDQSVTALSSTIPGSGIMEVSYTQPGNILVEAPNGTVNAAAGGILQLLLNGPPLPESTTLFAVPLNHAALAEMFDLALNGKMKAALDLQTALNGNPGNSVVDVFAGYELQQLDTSGNPIVDAYGDPVITALNLAEGTLVKTSDNQDITATGSGVLGAGSVTLDASGNITGNIFSLGNVNVNAVNNIDVSVLGLGNVNVASAGGTISGTIAGIESVSASGGSIDANLESNGSVSGNTSGQSGLAPGTAADAASQGMASDNSASPAKNDDTTATDDDLKKKGKTMATVQKRGRVTVLLPPKNLSQNQTSINHL